MTTTSIALWRSNDSIDVPSDASSADTLAPYARQLRPIDIEKIQRAFQAGLFELAVEFVWKRTMAILKRQLGDMGMSFVGEMLARPDIDEYSSVELVVTDYDSIQLSHQLGMINSIGAMELRHGAELLSHYASPNAEDRDELSKIQALHILHSCIAHVLAREKIELNFDFANFRHSLTQSVLAEDDEKVQYLTNAPYFYKRTVVRCIA